MNRSEIMKYYDAYNNGDFETVSAYYSDDLTFEYQGKKYEGKKAVFDWFAELGQAFSEKMTPTNILLEEDRMAVEMENIIEAKVDIPNLLGKSITIKAGESVTMRFGAFYDIRDEKFHYIRLYRFLIWKKWGP